MARRRLHRTKCIRDWVSRPPPTNQRQQFFAATYLNLSPKWEINFGLGIGVTAATDHLIVKGMLGRRFNWRKPSPVE
jgi:hypothetical protein